MFRRVELHRRRVERIEYRPSAFPVNTHGGLLAFGAPWDVCPSASTFIVCGARVRSQFLCWDLVGAGLPDQPRLLHGATRSCMRRRCTMSLRRSRSRLAPLLCGRCAALDGTQQTTRNRQCATCTMQLVTRNVGEWQVHNAIRSPVYCKGGIF